MKSCIVIPARYAAKRFPGKPLHIIAGKSLLRHVYDIAHMAAKGLDQCSIIVATDDARIQAHAETFADHVVQTPADCPSGSDRVLNAIDKLPSKPDIIINLQGDAPFTPPDFVRAILEVLTNDPSIQVATPYVQLSWEALDQLREQKQHQLFSGTTVVVDKHQNALWFSKQIIPAIRNEEQLREKSPTSPVLRHIGLYGYRYDALQQFVQLPPSHYEQLEGLEQCRFLENGIPIKAVQVNYQGRPAMSGVDTPEDAARAERLFSSGARYAKA